MSEAEPKSSEWTAAWIEQQRDLLRKQFASGAADAKGAQGEPRMTDEVRDLGEKWRTLAQSYLSGLAQQPQQPGEPSGAATGADHTRAPFTAGDELLNVWRSAWTTAGDIQQGAAGRFAELLARLPPIGLAREHTEAWHEAAAAQAECQRLEQELRATLLGVQSDALNLLERRVRERESSGEPLASYRDLYDLWVECAEQVYSKVAHSEAYSRLQAQLGNASMQLRSHQQKIIERALKQFDLPTRSELNTVHRQLREQKQKIASLELRLSQATATPPARKRRVPVKKAARKQAAAPGKKGGKKGKSR